MGSDLFCGGGGFVLINCYPVYCSRFGKYLVDCFECFAPICVGIVGPKQRASGAGDEFLMILPDTGLKDAEMVARRLHNLIGGKLLKVEKGEFQVRTCIGVAGTESNDEDVYDLDRLLDMAGKAMYKAKEAGRFEVVVYREDEVEE
ncbi:MAG: diguanylate cyclase [Anaerolineales bacterium]|nr:MAG: diguanylate cyclase [Anaerolineales bacterium]